jgi:hypothetical protein
MILFKNIPFSDVRLTLSATGSVIDNYVTEGIGDRYYYKDLGTASSVLNMEAATFRSFVSFTQSSTAVTELVIAPMLPNEIITVECSVTGINEDGSKGYTMKSFGGYIHDGSTINMIGSSIDYTQKSDFTSASASYDVLGTASVCLIFSGESGEVIDWDIYINFRKGYTDLLIQNSCNDNICKPIYPK